MQHEDINQQPGPRSPSRAPPRPHRISKSANRSCIVCHRRKVRCDRKSPCSTCTSTGVLCCYPSGDQPLSRHPKATIADIISRLGQLERTLLAVSENISTTRPSGEPDRGAGDQSAASGSQRGDQPTEEILVHSGGSTHYVNDVILSRVLEEEKEVRGVLAAAGAQAYESGAPRALGLLSVVCNDFPNQLVLDEETRLSSWQYMQLWQVFLQNVDPMAKMLHIPTTQISIFTAISKPDESAPDVQCLLFSICFAAATSLSPEEVSGLLGKDKAVALSQLRLGIESCLVQSNFFENPTLTALEAMALFLRITRARNTGRSLWLLWGLVLRAAMSIGLHRDGACFNLSPFESEMRRRVWWHMKNQDARAAEDHGIVTLPMDTENETRLPLNVNDSELEPSMRQLPAPKAGWTEMTLPIIMMEISKTTQQLARLLARSGTSPDEEKRKEIVGRQRERVEALLHDCNQIVPQQRAVAMIARLRLKKFDFTSRMQWLSAESRTTGAKRAHATEENLQDACEVVEMGLRLDSDDMLRNYRWLADLYPQFHALLYIVWHLGSEPGSGIAERAWRAVDAAFDQQKDRKQRQVTRETQNPIESKWSVLSILRDKARARSGQFRAQGEGHPSVAVAPVQQQMVDVELPSEAAYTAADGTATVQEVEFPDFENLIDGFELNWSYDFTTHQ